MSLNCRSLIVACIALGLALSGQQAQAGIMEGIVNQVFAKLEHDVKHTFSRKPSLPDVNRPQAGSPTTIQPPQYRRPYRRGLFR